jgi:hypothetical protein
MGFEEGYGSKKETAPDLLVNNKDPPAQLIDVTLSLLLIPASRFSV